MRQHIRWRWREDDQSIMISHPLCCIISLYDRFYGKVVVGVTTDSNGFVGFDQALFIAEKLRAQFVFDMAQMEGNTATYPQVETIVHGTSVAGLSMSETRQIDNINRGWNALLEDLNIGRFQINKLVAIEYNKLVAEGENRIGYGGFRTGLVAIGGTSYTPPNPLDLNSSWDALLVQCNALSDTPLEQSLLLYADMARNQFFSDGNKRTALLMMNGNLIRHGLCPITITKSREVEYRTALIGYYESPETYKKILFDFLKEEQQAMLSRWGYVVSNNSASIIAPTIDIDRAATKRKG